MTAEIPFGLKIINTGQFQSRPIEALQHRVNGHSVAETANIMGISVPETKNHITHIFKTIEEIKEDSIAFGQDEPKWEKITRPMHLSSFFAITKDDMTFQSYRIVERTNNPVAEEYVDEPYQSHQISRIDGEEGILPMADTEEFNKAHEITKVPRKENAKLVKQIFGQVGLKEALNELPPFPNKNK